MSYLKGPSILLDTLYSILLSLILMWISLRGYQQPDIFRATVIEAIANEKSNNKMLLTNTEISELESQLKILEQSQSFYLQPEISLPALAALLKIRPQILSFYLNEHKGSNFYDYINSLRIQAVCESLDNPDNDGSILSIALDKGFSNKSTFNSAFKKHVGMTPSEYRKFNKNLTK